MNISTPRETKGFNNLNNSSLLFSLLAGGNIDLKN